MGMKPPPRDPLTGIKTELDPQHTWTSTVDWAPSMVYPRLWVGGVPDLEAMTLDVPGGRGPTWSPSAHKERFDAVVTMSALAGPAGSGVLELRAGLIDKVGEQPSPELVAEAVAATLRWHGEGKKVLVRCRAGLNRSALVAALALVHLEGITPGQAVTALRERRHPDALCNPTLEAAVLHLGRSRGFRDAVAAMHGPRMTP